MADLSRVKDKISTLSQKLDELVAFKAQAVSDGGSGDGGQAAVNEIESDIDQLLARLP